MIRKLQLVCQVHNLILIRILLVIVNLFKLQGVFNEKKLT